MWYLAQPVWWKRKILRSQGATAQDHLPSQAPARGVQSRELRRLRSDSSFDGQDRTAVRRDRELDQAGA